MKRPKHRYEPRAFCRNTRGNFRRVRGGTMHETDPYWMAIELWRLQHERRYLVCSIDWRYEVVDLWAGRGKLAPVVSYDELLRRARSRRSA